MLDDEAEIKEIADAIREKLPHTTSVTVIPSDEDMFDRVIVRWPMVSLHFHTGYDFSQCTACLEAIEAVIKSTTP